MAFQPVPDTAIAEVLCVIGANNVELTFHAQKTGGYTAVDIFNLAAAVDTWAGSDLRNNISQEVNYLRTEVRGLENQNDLFDLANAGTGFGVVNSPTLPANVAFAVKRSSAFTGRSARGRVYWFGITEADVSVNNLAQARADSIQLACNNIIDAMAAQSWTHVIVSRFTNNQPRPQGITFAVEAYSYTNLRVDTRRDRIQV